MFSYIFASIINKILTEFIPSSETKANISIALTTLDIGINSGDTLYISNIQEKEKKEKQKTE